MLRLALVVVPLIAFAACNTENKAYCTTHAGMDGCPPPDAPSGGHCTNNNDCTTMNFPACDTKQSPPTCVQCTTNESCTGATPICMNDSCVACTTDSDCGTGGLCIPGGACATSDNIIHAVSMNGATSPPCGSTGTPCTLTAALAAVDATKYAIQLDDDGPFSADGYTVTNDVTIDARRNTTNGASITRTGMGSILTIGPGRTVNLLGGTIQGVPGNNTAGIQCNGADNMPTTLTIVGSKIDGNDQSGINADTCALNITKATISNNGKRMMLHYASINILKGSLSLSLSQLTSNQGGGLSITNGTFTIVGNVFANNGEGGTSGAAVGGILVSTAEAPSNRLEFNTIAMNKVQTLNNNAPGIQCAAGNFTATSNILWGNDNGIAPRTEIGGSCQHAYSDIDQPTLIQANDGGHNLNADPMFNTGFSVKKGSPVLGKADPLADLTGIASKDLAGQTRIKPADMGAYQVPAQ